MRASASMGTWYPRHAGRQSPLTLRIFSLDVYNDRCKYVRSVETFGVLGDPVRRRILELLATDEQPAGDVAAVIQGEFGLTQPAVSRHLRVLRENGFATVRSAGTRRLYGLDGAGLEAAQGWLADLRGQWSQRLDAIETELAPGRRRTPTNAKRKEHAA